MDFVAVLDQAIALLRQRGRVTYRTLQLQFALDDAQLAALKDELLYSQPQVIDDAGRGMVWTGASPAAASDTHPQAEAERQLHRALPAVLMLLQREQRVTYRSLRYVCRTKSPKAELPEGCDLARRSFEPTACSCYARSHMASTWGRRGP